MHPLLIGLLLESHEGGPARDRWSWRGQYRTHVLRKDPCWYCGCRPIRPFKNWSVDHLVPRARGGTNDIQNLAGMCPTCNSHKDKHEPLQFLVREAHYRRGLAIRRMGRKKRKKLRRMIALLLAAA